MGKMPAGFPKKTVVCQIGNSGTILILNWDSFEEVAFQFV